MHVALRNPLDLTLAPAFASDHPPALVAAYADTPATIDAVGAALTGRAPFRGVLPVTLPHTTAAPSTPVRTVRPTALGALA